MKISQIVILIIGLASISAAGPAQGGKIFPFD